MSITKKTLKLSDALKSTFVDGDIVGGELHINAGDEALETVLEGTGISVDQYRDVIKHNPRVVTTLAHAAGETAVEKMADNDEINSVVVTLPVTEDHVHTARVARIHEPVEGKPVYGHTQIHSAFAMDENTDKEFKSVLRSINKKAQAAFSDIE